MKIILNILIFISSIISIYPKTIIHSPGQNLTATLTQASDFDTIYISSGYYKETDIVINKPLTIIGIGNPTIDAELKGKNCFLIESDNVIIKNLTITNINKSAVSDNAAIKLNNVKNCRIIGNKIQNAFFGIYLAKSSYCLIDSNRLTGKGQHEAYSGNGIHLWTSSHNLITNNIINSHRDGIYLEFVRNSEFINNLCQYNLRYGLHFMFSDSSKYMYNTFKKNGAGVAVMYTKNIEMKNNLFISNWGPASYGLLLKDISNSLIENNEFRDNSVGIHLEGSSRLIVRKNTLIQNGWAVRLMANCANDEFTKNNFTSNTFDVATNSRQNYNHFSHNYWSNYNGYDINRDGIGDVPYHPVKLFSLIVSQDEETLILIHSFFIELLDLIERIFPILTPETLIDTQPEMKAIT